jgi:hypothetical protein
MVVRKLAKPSRILVSIANEEDKAARLRNPDRLSIFARKKSKAASNGK